MRELSRKDIIKYLRDEEFVLTKKDAIIITDAIFDYIKWVLTKALASWEDVRLTLKWFWNFYTYSKPGQKKYNPRTKQYQQSPDRRIVKFKRSKFLSFPEGK
mgnify:CR=1 FL=1